MKKEKYLLDTHALFFWLNQNGMSVEFIKNIDKQAEDGNVYVSPVSIWEIALLVKKGRIYVKNLHLWEKELLNYSPVILINPTTSDMIDSTLLPDHHKDPFDRLLIAQAKNNNAVMITKDKNIAKYRIKTFWM